MCGASFAAGYLYRPIGAVSQVEQVVETAKDGAKKITTVTTKGIAAINPAASDLYRPNYTIEVSRGIFEQYRVATGYRLLGNLWVIGGYSAFNDVSLGLRMDF